MDQYLDIEQRIRLSVKIGESSVREFKSALQGRPGEKQPRSAKDIMTDVACTLVAFANSDGGELLIGVEDNGQITGVPHDENTINTILDATESHIHQDTPLPIPRKGIVYIDNKVVIYFSLSKGTRYVHLTRDGRCLKRLDRESVPVSSEEIRARRFEDGSREWDRQIAGGATLADLDLDLLEEISNQITPGVSIEKSLQYLELAEFSHDGLVLKNAAMVLFAKNIGKWHPGCSVRILHVDGREQRSGSQFNVKAEPIIQSNILRLQDSSWQRLNLALSQKPKFTENAQFQQTFLYPQTASREALINAIVHRNYLIQRGIEIYIYSDRMEIISPGMLLSTVSIDDLVKLTGIHESRNPLIARVLREMGLVREMGEGIRRIYDVMRSSSLAEPHLSNDTTGFTVTLYHKSMYDPRVRLWLSEFEENYKLTENQKAILALGFDNQEFSVQEIIDRLGIIDIGKITEIITPLRTWGLVDRTGTQAHRLAKAKKLGIPNREVKSYYVVENGNNTEFANDIEPETLDDTIRHDIFISNINYNAKKREIVESFTDFGNVLSLTLPTHPSGRNKGYCFLTIENTEDTSKVISKLNQFKFMGRTLRAQKQR